MFEVCQEPPSNGQSQFAALQELYDGDLFSLIKSCEPSEQLPEWQKLHIMHQTLRSVYELHKKGFVHRDVKPENFLIKIINEKNAVNGQISVRLADLAYIVDLRLKTAIPDNVCGSPRYCAPECAQLLNTYRGLKRPANAIQEQTSTRIDIWALGLLFLWMIDQTLCDKIAPRTQAWIPLWSNYYRDKTIAVFPEPKDRESLLHLVWEMLRPCPEDRISSKEALAKLEKIQLESRDPIEGTLKMETQQRRQLAEQWIWEQAAAEDRAEIEQHEIESRARKWTRFTNGPK